MSVAQNRRQELVEDDLNASEISLVDHFNEYRQMLS